MRDPLEQPAAPGAYVQPSGTVFDRVRPAGSRTRIVASDPGRRPQHVVLERLAPDGTELARIAFDAAEIDDVVAALKQARVWLLGTPQAAGPHAVLRAPARGKRR